MVVQHNLTAMNSNRMLGITTSTQAKSTEKLSSGYKINRAADDAAGLSISEKMRKQIRGLTQASSNAQDGISAVQTAEGALNEVQDMLQRMNELAVKASNGTMSADDRSYIQNEIDQLVVEIDRVSETTKFNETYLLRGEAGVDAAYTAANAQTITFSTDGTGGAGKFTNGKLEVAIEQDANTAKAVNVGGTSLTLLSTASVNDPNYTVKANEYASMDDLLADVKEKLMSSNKNIKDVTYDGKKLVATAFADTKQAMSFKLHVGADSDDTNKIGLDVSHLSARGLDVNGLRVDGNDDTNATGAIDKITAAIQKVSTQRSALGAIQNRLEHTINNLDNVVENTTSAESQIRDTDMASEMVKYSNNNILAQAGQSMLAQANQSNQGVLSLLG